MNGSLILASLVIEECSRSKHSLWNLSIITNSLTDDSNTLILEISVWVYNLRYISILKSYVDTLLVIMSSPRDIKATPPKDPYILQRFYYFELLF